MRRKTTDSRGIAIAPILFVIALLAILATAISAGSGTFSAGTDQEIARVGASTILDMCSQYRIAVNRLIAGGCKDTEISFENSEISGYTNASAPADGHCHVFRPQGGGLVFRSVPVEYFDKTATIQNGATTWDNYFKNAIYREDFTGDNRMHSIGTSVDGPTGNELIWVIRVVKPAVCDQINTQLANASKDSMTISFYNHPFIGSYNHSVQYVMPISLAGKMSACAVAAGDHTGSHSFMCVILPR